MAMVMMMSKANLAKGAVILSLAGLISKAIGALYRIPLFRMIGAEGMGLYQMAYPLYALLLTVSSAGIPVAISKIVAEKNLRRDQRGAQQTLCVGLIMMAVAGIVGSLLLFLSAEIFAEKVLKDVRAYYSILAIAPAVFFVALMSVFRGYFQGFQLMLPTALSQIVEQTVRVAFLLIGAYLFWPKGIHFAAAAATSGAVAGAVAGLTVLIIYFSWRGYQYIPIWDFFGGRNNSGFRKTAYRILALSLPISLGGVVLPMIQIMDAVTVPLRLQQAGYSATKSAELYGQLTGGGNTLINLPGVFTLALATTLVPLVSELKAGNNLYRLKSYIDAAVKASLTIGLPAAAGLFLLAEPLSALLFDCPEAGRPLSVLAPAAIFLGLHQTTSGVLQGLGKTHLPAKNLLVGVVVKLILNYKLTAISGFGIRGAAIGTVAGFFVSSILNCYDLYRIVGWRINWQVLSKPVAAVTIMSVGVYFTFNSLKLGYGDEIAALACVLVGALIYITFIVVFDRGENSIIGFIIRMLKRRK